MRRGVGAVALLLTAATPSQAHPTGEVTLRQWSRLAQVERQTMIVAAVEGLLLAAAGPTETVPRVDSQCIGTVPLARLEQKLVAMSRTRDAAFIDMFLEVSGCSRS